MEEITSALMGPWLLKKILGQTRGKLLERKDFFSLKIKSSKKNHHSLDVELDKVNDKVYSYSITNKALENLKPSQCLYSLFLENLDYNFQQVLFCPEAKKIFYTKDFIDFLENKIVLYNPKSTFSLSSLLDALDLKTSGLNIKFNELDVLKMGSLYFLNLGDSSKMLYGCPVAIDTGGNLSSDLGFNIKVGQKESFYRHLDVLENVFSFSSSGQSDSCFGALFVNLDVKKNPAADLFRHLSATGSRLGFSLGQFEFFIKGTIERQKKLSALIKFGIIPVLKIKEKNFNHIESMLCEDFSFIKLYKLSEFLKDHCHIGSKVVPVLVAQGWSIRLIIDFLNYFNKQRQIVIGFLENFKIDYPVPKNTQEVIGIAKSIIKIFWDEKLKYQKKLVEPLDLSDFEFASSVRELTTNIDLELEGEELAHCVGGYVNSVGTNHRIFTITFSRVSKERSTLEIKSNNKGANWRKIQHRGPKNSQPSQYVIEIGNKLVSFLNQTNTCQLSSDEYYKEIKSIVGKFKELELSTLVLGAKNWKELTAGVGSKDFSEDVKKIGDKNIELFVNNLKDIYEDKKSLVILTMGNTYAHKNQLKARGFSWNPGESAWWTLVKYSQIDAESAWLENLRGLEYSFLNNCSKKGAFLLEELAKYRAAHPDNFNQNHAQRFGEIN